MMRASVVLGGEPGAKAAVLIDGADTPVTANGLAGYAPTAGDRLLVQQVGGMVEVVQFLTRGTVPYIDADVLAGLESDITSAQTAATAAQTAADNAVAAAQAAQATAQTAADNASSALAELSGKGAIYAQPTAPPIDPNGLWIDTDDGNKPYTVVGGVWTASQDASIETAADAAAAAQASATAANDAATSASDAAQAAHDLAVAAQGTANQAQTAAADAQTSADNAQTAANDAQTAADAANNAALDAANIAAEKGTVYTQATAPAADPNGLWINTSDGNKPYTYDTATSAWVASQDAAVIAAASAAATAQTAADTASTNAYNAQQAADAANQATLTNSDVLTGQGTTILSLSDTVDATQTSLTDYQTSTDATLGTLQSAYGALTAVGTAGVEEDYFWVGDDPALSTVKSVQISTYLQDRLSAGDDDSFAAAFGLWNRNDIGDIQFVSDDPPMTTFYTCFTDAGLLAKPWNA